MQDEVSLKRMFLISILLHLLLLLVPLHTFMEHSQDALASQLKAEPPKKMTFVFVETPENAVESPVEQITPFISDKSLAASNPQAPQELPLGQPYQEGRSEVPAMQPETAPSTAPQGTREASRQSPEERLAEQQSSQQEAGSNDAFRELEALNRLAPSKKEQPLSAASSVPQGEESRPYAPPAPRFDSRRQRAPVGSDFQLSTYNWNWAPYLKELKRRIESNIYPPPAFFMGLVHGRIFLRFKILQDGTMTEFELINYTGHESLMKTSVHSIESSAPFLPLPSDFPENSLGITVGFYYNEFIH